LSLDLDEENKTSDFANKNKILSTHNENKNEEKSEEAIADRWKQHKENKEERIPRSKSPPRISRDDKESDKNNKSYVIKHQKEKEEEQIDKSSLRGELSPLSSSSKKRSSSPPLLSSSSSPPHFSSVSTGPTLTEQIVLSLTNSKKRSSPTRSGSVFGNEEEEERPAKRLRHEK
jgi:hypothetical protein